MEQKIKERLELLRQAMQQQGVQACIVPGTDPHAGEYIADHWKERNWITGFTGSAGTAAFTLKKGGLWTDSRYFLQGTEQLEGSTIQLMKQGLPDTKEIVPWLASELNAADKVAVNPQMFSVKAYAKIKEELALYQIELVSIDLFKNIWADRASLPSEPFFIFEEKYTGKSTKDKLKIVREKIKEQHANVFILSALDDIAWLFNIRGKDVAYNPVTIAYGLVEEDKATLFVDKEKCTDKAQQHLEKNGIQIADYTGIYSAIQNISPEKSVLIDDAKLNQSLFEAIPKECNVRMDMSPVFKLKSIKNEKEIAGTRRAMIKDGIALTRFFMWLEDTIKKESLTEISITEKLREFRAKQDDFVGESFATIAGYAEHGAIVHYSATLKSNAELKQKGLLLLDSGGQYLDGTTDITRTIPLGEPTEEEITDYTLVLKGHINLAMAKYPENTRGSQLDILARKAMWDRAINYGHGTGHGIGHFLNVHEGPQSIRMDENSTTLKPGMITSNEPGIYRTDKHGIRIENLVLTVPAEKSKFGQFYKFETLTYCYIDTSLVEKSLLTETELKWLNDYNESVYQEIYRYLMEDERLWLRHKTKAI